jgi:pimeloyl-ACP methyl ester carboxylesterase
LAKNNSANGPARARRYGVMLMLLGLLPVAAAAQAPLTAAHLDQFDARKAAVALRNGEKLAYIDAGPRDAPPLVLIHGYTDSARDWAPIAPPLTPQFRLIIVDLRGHGASGKPDCCYTRFDFAYDIKLLLDALHIRTTNVAGHSLGSIVAQTFAELWPESTRAIADQCLVGVDLRSMLPRVQASTLLIWGARDTLVSEAGREALRSGIAQVDVRTFASLGHDLFWEDPREVAAVMIEFLTKP